MTQRLCTHAALTPGAEPRLDATTGELRLPITLYNVDEPVQLFELVLSASDAAVLLDVMLPPVTK